MISQDVLYFKILPFMRLVDIYKLGLQSYALSMSCKREPREVLELNILAGIPISSSLASKAEVGTLLQYSISCRSNILWCYYFNSCKWWDVWPNKTSSICTMLLDNIDYLVEMYEDKSWSKIILYDSIVSKVGLNILDHIDMPYDEFYTMIVHYYRVSYDDLISVHHNGVSVNGIMGAIAKYEDGESIKGIVRGILYM